MDDQLTSMGSDILLVLNVGVLLYFFVINLSYLGLVTVSFFYIKRQFNTLGIHQLPDIYKNELYKSYSIIVPAYNEGKEIIGSVQAFLQQQYGDFEVIVVNDGSTDQTLEYLKTYYELCPSERYISDELDHKPINEVYVSARFPNLIVIDKENGKKADAMNAGINAARKDLFCATDGDSVLEHDVLWKMFRSFVVNDDTIAAGGIIRVENGCTFDNGELKEINIPGTLLGCIQVIEYVRAFLLGRTGWEYFDGLLIIAGGFGVFDREAVLKVGGYDPDAIGEDFELVVKLHRYYKKRNLPYRIAFQPEPVCWTEVPETWGELSSQRNRWQRGLLQTLWKYRDMLFNSKFGFVGMVAMPFYFIFELMGPVVELFGYIFVAILLITGLLPPETALLFFIVAILLGILLSIASLLCDELTYNQYPKFKDIIVLIGISIFESFGYRQLHTWWRFQGMVEYMFGNMGWNKTSKNPKLLNATYWIIFGGINLLIIYLFYYGLTKGSFAL